MSIQDDYFDVRSTLEAYPDVVEQFDNIWEVFCLLEETVERLKEEAKENKAAIRSMMKLRGPA